MYIEWKIGLFERYLNAYERCTYNGYNNGWFNLWDTHACRRDYFVTSTFLNKNETNKS